MYYTFGTFRFSETSQDEVTEQFGSEVLKEITPARLFSLSKAKVYLNFYRFMNIIPLSKV